MIQGQRRPLLVTFCAHPVGQAVCHPNRRPFLRESLGVPGVFRFVAVVASVVLLVVVRSWFLVGVICTFVGLVVSSVSWIIASVVALTKELSLTLFSFSLVVVRFPKESSSRAFVKWSILTGLVGCQCLVDLRW